ncbi:MAG: hypothetical protein AAGE96_06640 [Cyanobacteria bacterium P01_G01_bin.19]
MTERIESLKAGIVGAGAFAIAEFTTIVAQTVVSISLLKGVISPAVLDWQLLLHLAIGAVSGFLFGVTYRYIIRDDRNSHLSEGAVLAFSLVRGLALIENNLVLTDLLSLLFFILQSIVCFAIARSILDLAIKRKLIRPFV